MAAEYMGISYRTHLISGSSIEFVAAKAQDWVDENISGTRKELISISISPEPFTGDNVKAHALITYSKNCYFSCDTHKAVDNK